MVDVGACIILKNIAARNGCKNNKVISERTGISYEIVNRSLREADKITPGFLETFFSTFSDATIQEKKDITLKVDLARSSDLVRDEFARMNFMIKDLQEARETGEEYEIFKDALEYALERGLLEKLMKRKKDR